MVVFVNGIIILQNYQSLHWLYLYETDKSLHQTDFMQVTVRDGQGIDFTLTDTFTRITFINPS